MTSHWKTFKVKAYLKDGKTIERTFYSSQKMHMNDFNLSVVCERMGCPAAAVKSITAWEIQE